MNAKLHADHGLNERSTAIAQFGNSPHTQPQSSEPLELAPTSAPEWANIIMRALMLKTLEIIQFGVIIHGARTRLDYGEWSGLFRGKDRLPFGKTTGEKWDRIGEVWGPLAQVPEHLGKIPIRFEVLDVLARLGTELLLELLRDDTIKSGLRARAAWEIVARGRKGVENLN